MSLSLAIFPTSFNNLVECGLFNEWKVRQSSRIRHEDGCAEIFARAKCNFMKRRTPTMAIHEAETSLCLG
jgi:hypothetical protein